MEEGAYGEIGRGYKLRGEVVTEDCLRKWAALGFRWRVGVKERAIRRRVD